MRNTVGGALPALQGTDAPARCKGWLCCKIGNLFKYNMKEKPDHLFSKPFLSHSGVGRINKIMLVLTFEA